MQNYFGVDSSVLQTSAVKVSAFEVTENSFGWIIVATEEVHDMFLAMLDFFPICHPSILKEEKKQLLELCNMLWAAASSIRGCSWALELLMYLQDPKEFFFSETDAKALPQSID
jgi:hypothetical protein